MQLKRGFTLIELLIGLAILGFLFALGAPAFNDWIGNTKIRSTATSIAEGIQLARAEAVKRNNETLFIRVGPDYQVCEVAVAGGPCPGSALILSHDGGSSSSVTQITVGGATTARFTALGRLTPAAPVLMTVTHNTMTVAAQTPLNIIVGIGGQAKLCDPKAAAGDSRACI